MATNTSYPTTLGLSSKNSAIHDGWKALRACCSSSEKALLTRKKKFYARIIQEDPDSAAELLAFFDFERKSPDDVICAGAPITG